MHLPVYVHLQINKIKFRSLKEILSEEGKKLNMVFI